MKRTAKYILALSLALCSCQKPSSDQEQSQKPLLVAPVEPPLIPSTTSVVLPEIMSNASPAARAAMTEELLRQPYLKWREALDREELVRKAPPVGASSSTIRLALLLKKNVVSPGETLWYRAELQNHGDSELLFDDAASFFKDNACEKGHFQLWLTAPNGSKTIIRREASAPAEEPDIVRPVRFPASVKPEDRARQAQIIQERLRRKQDERFGLHLSLRPGEALQTRPEGGFRELKGAYELTERGRHRLTIVYVGGKGFSVPVESASVEFEVR